MLKGGKGYQKGDRLGDSLDFYGHHKYVHGDDVRRMNWKIFMRTEDFYIKDFSEERQLHVHVIMDSSSSMDFGSPSKWEIEKSLGTGIGYLTLKQMDILNLYTIDQHLHSVLKNAKGRAVFYQFSDLISQLKPKGRTNLKEIQNIGTLGQGITFLISDFFDNQLEETLDFLSLENQELVVIHVLSPSELNPGYEKDLKLVDMETGSIRNVYISDQVKEAYRKKVAEFIGRCEKICRDKEAKYVLATTDLQPKEILARVLGGYR